MSGVCNKRGAGGGEDAMKKLLEAVKGYIQDIKSGEKKLSKDGMLILFFSGLLIYVIFLPVDKNTSYRKEQAEKKVQEQQEYRQESIEENDYQGKLERELAEFLAKVEGIGEVEVLIYLKESEEYIVEKDIPSYLVNAQDANGQSCEENKEEDTVYTVNGNGEQVPFVAQTKHPAIEGVVIAADGAGQENIRIKIIRMVMALYGVEANKIDVLERKKILK